MEGAALGELQDASSGAVSTRHDTEASWAHAAVGTEEGDLAQRRPEPQPGCPHTPPGGRDRLNHVNASHGRKEKNPKKKLLLRLSENSN